MKKIIRNAWAVMITLYSWWLPCRYCTPGAASSIRIITLNAVPSIPLNTAKIRYSVPMSLAFVEKSHRVTAMFKCCVVFLLPMIAYLIWYTSESMQILYMHYNRNCIAIISDNVGVEPTSMSPNTLTVSNRLPPPIGDCPCRVFSL